MSRTVNIDIICEIIDGSLDWQSGEEFTASTVRRKANSSRHTTITLDHATTALEALESRGSAFQVKPGRFKKAISQDYRASWRKHTNEEIGIYSKLIAGMGWMPVHTSSL